MVNETTGTTSLDVVNSIDLILEFDTASTPTQRANDAIHECRYYPGYTG